MGTSKKKIYILTSNPKTDNKKSLITLGVKGMIILKWVLTYLMTLKHNKC